MMRPLPKFAAFLLLAATALTVSSLSGCAEEAVPYVTCTPAQRIVLSGNLGEVLLRFSPDEPLPSKFDEAGQVGFSLTFEEYDRPTGEEARRIVRFHMINTSRDNRPDDLGTIQERIEQRAIDQGGLPITLDVVERDDDVLCDPVDGVICSVLGTDVNNDGMIAFTDAEEKHIGTSGTLTILRNDGNALWGTFSVTYGRNVHTEEMEGLRTSDGATEELSIEGGPVDGCFRMMIGTDRVTLQ